MNKSFLPNIKYYEYAYHKWFSDNPVEWDSWKPASPEWDYPDQDVTRFSKIIGENVDIIKGKRVVDFACHLGYIGLFCLHNQAQFVTGTNVRQNCLNIADEICFRAGYNNYSFVNSNIYDYAKTTELCNNADTAILAGIFYHLHDHYGVIESITRSTVKNIIIETTNIETDKPVVEWRVIKESDVSGFSGVSVDLHYEGKPSDKWIEDIMHFFKWNLQTKDHFIMPDNHPANSKRSVLVFSR